MTDDMLFTPTGDEFADNCNLPSILHFVDGFDDAFVIERLIELFRSDIPLHPTLRRQIASALEGSHPELRLTLARKKRGPKPKSSKMARRAMTLGQAMGAGKFIASFVGSDGRIEGGILAAMDKFAMTRAEAYAAWSQWKAANAELERLQSNLPRNFRTKQL